MGKLLENSLLPEGMTKEEELMHQRLNEIVDITKPLVPQVAKMTNREFMAFVRRPRYIESEDAIQLFEDPKEDENGKTRYATNVAVVLHAHPVLTLVLQITLVEESKTSHCLAKRILN